ncbi:hypothetical protein GCM10025879_18940 [Leuconostoc litchii]|nr:hypothetical protein GCM10025879_18940 [Leuconostoc litchii]
MIRCVYNLEQKSRGMNMTTIKEILSRRDWENPIVTNFHRLPLHTEMTYMFEYDGKETQQLKKVSTELGSSVILKMYR